MKVSVMPRYFLAILRSPFLRKGNMQPFVYPYVVFWVYTALQYRSTKTSNFLVFHTSRGISLKLTAFIFSTMSRSSWVNSPSFMCCWWLIIFVIGLFVTLDQFPSRFLKCSLLICIRFSWLPAFSLALEFFFLLLTSFNVCHTIRDCLFIAIFSLIVNK